MEETDVVIIGAGASGLMCAIEAGRRGRRVQVIDHARRPGNKIRMAGGGRCNFTNYDVEPGHYLSSNPHFVKSALSRYTQWDFLALVGRYGIAYHEREHGQLFCDDSAKAILEMLLAECRTAGVTLKMKTSVEAVERDGDGFRVRTDGGPIRCDSLVVATGGLSIPTAGASPLGYRIAEQFGVPVRPTRAGLVPFTLKPKDKARFAPLAGIAVPAAVSAGGRTFTGNVLFTHRGLSGPAVLQASSYWQPGDPVTLDWLPGTDLPAWLRQERRQHPKRQLKTVLAAELPQRLVAALLDAAIASTPLADLSDARIDAVAESLHGWPLVPQGTEGYRTAEVTVGGVDCDAVSSKTFEAKAVPGLYFIGEVLDVTGWLGGYNLQWAWSSGWCAGQVV